MRLGMRRGILVTGACLAFFLTGCGAEGGDGSGDSGGNGGKGGNGGNGGNGGSAAAGSSGTGGGAPKCEDAFAKVPLPYAPNTSLDEWGGFAVDERGAVFSAIPDSSLTDDTSAYHPLIMASDLAGNLTTLYTGDGSSLFGNFILQGDSVYMLAGVVVPGIARLDRRGGEPVEVVEGTVFAGPVLSDDFIYYAKAGASGDGIYRLDPATDASTLVIAREDEIDVLDVDGDTLYWIESDGFLADTDYRLFSMPVAGGTATLVQSLPRAELAIGSFRVIDRVLFGSEITADFDLVVTRTPIGEAPTIVEDFGGLPMTIADGFAYYGSGSGGITKAPLSFQSKTTIAGSDDRSIYSLAVGPSDLWYSELSCIFRAPK